MKLFLTSAIGATIKKDGERCTGKIDNRYGFLTLFKKQLKRADRMLYIAAIYNDQTRIDAYFKTTIEALKNENIQFRENILINGVRVKMDIALVDMQYDDAAAILMKQFKDAQIAKNPTSLLLNVMQKNGSCRRIRMPVSVFFTGVTIHRSM